MALTATSPLERGPKYVIRDKIRGGYAENNPIEGWCFTALVSQATVFSRKADALDIAAKYYDVDTVEVVAAPSL